MIAAFVFLFPPAAFAEDIGNCVCTGMDGSKVLNIAVSKTDCLGVFKKSCADTPLFTAYRTNVSGNCSCALNDGSTVESKGVTEYDCFTKYKNSCKNTPQFTAVYSNDVGDCSCTIANGDKIVTKGVTRETCMTTKSCVDTPVFGVSRTRVDYCCCRNVDKNTKCVKLSNFSDNRQCGVNNFDDKASAPNNAFEVLDIPQSGSCAQYVQDETKPSKKSNSSSGSSASGDDLSVDKLQKQAAGLNQFTQFANTDPAQLGAAFIGVGVKILLSFIGALSLLLYVIAGVLWMTAQGKSEQIQKSKTILLWTTLGIVAMLSSYLVVSGFFGLFRKP